MLAILFFSHFSFHFLYHQRATQLADAHWDILEKKHPGIHCLEYDLHIKVHIVLFCTISLLRKDIPGIIFLAILTVDDTGIFVSQIRPPREKYICILLAVYDTRSRKPLMIICSIMQCVDFFIIGWMVESSSAWIAFLTFYFVKQSTSEMFISLILMLKI